MLDHEHESSEPNRTPISASRATKLWQRDADLLAQARLRLERACESWRSASLYPEGANYSLLLMAYQDLERWRDIYEHTRSSDEALRRRNLRVERRWLLAALDRRIKRDIDARHRRVRVRYPLPRQHLLHGPHHPLVLEALEAVDDDVRHGIGEWLKGEGAHGETAADLSSRMRRGLSQFREAFLVAALRSPHLIRGLHPQYIGALESAMPLRRRFPLARTMLVALPVRIASALSILFGVVYIAAFFFFNDARLGSTLGSLLSRNFDGELAIESIHWNPWLIFDLLVGRPHTVTVKGVRIYEPYKKSKREKQLAVYAEAVEVDLVLHEIIPWNRLGVPAVLDIPWNLHFRRAVGSGDIWITARAYQDGDHTVVTLRDAFKPPVPFPPRPGVRRIGFVIEGISLPGLRLKLDWLDVGNWGTDLRFDNFRGQLEYEGTFPEAPSTQLPLRFQTRGKVLSGTVLAMGRRLDLEDFTFNDISSGSMLAPLGDIHLTGDGTLAQAPATLDTTFRGVFSSSHPLAISAKLATTDAEPLIDAVVPLPPNLGSGKDAPRKMIGGDDVRAMVQLSGYLSDPNIRVVAQGLTIDLFEDPSWALDDVDLSMVMARDPLPEMWGVRGADGSGPAPDRWVIWFESLRATGLNGGDLRLHGRGSADHIVLASTPEDPMLVSLDLDVESVDPSVLFADTPEASQLLAGFATGEVRVSKVVLPQGGAGGLDDLDLSFRGVKLERSKPEPDSIPRSLTLNGDLRYRPARGVDARALSVHFAGGEVSWTGSLAADLATLRPSVVRANISDGNAFARAIGMAPAFRSVSAELAVQGPLTAPRGDGDLVVEQLRSGDLTISSQLNARLELSDGQLSARVPELRALGGNGDAVAKLAFARGGRFLTTPEIALRASLEGLELAKPFGAPLVVTNGRLDIFVDDGSKDRTVAMDKLRVRGGGSADNVRLGTTDYGDAQVGFFLDDDVLHVTSLDMVHHVAVSPKTRPRTQVAVGRVHAEGSIGLDARQDLAVKVAVEGLPISAASGLAMAESPVHGSFARGTAIELSGSLRAPRIDGTVELRGLSASGLPLGGGTVLLSTSDGKGPVPFRQVRAAGEFAGQRADKDLAWSVDALVGLADRTPPGQSGVEAAVELSFATLPIATLLAMMEQDPDEVGVEGALYGLSLSTNVCEQRGTSMLESCREERGRNRGLTQGGAKSADPAWSVDMTLQKAALRPTEARSAASRQGRRGQDRGKDRGGEAPRQRRSIDVCDDARGVCLTAPDPSQPMSAQIVPDRVTLANTWMIRSGGLRGASLSLHGDFDLKQPSAKQAACSDPSAAASATGDGNASLEGQLDLGLVDLFLDPAVVRGAEGRVEVDVDLRGSVYAPSLFGTIKAAYTDTVLRADLMQAAASPDEPAVAVPLALRDFDARLNGHSVEIDGELEVFAQTLNLHSSDKAKTWYTFLGGCAGRFGLRLNGYLDLALARVFAPDLVTASSGRIEVQQFALDGDANALSDPDNQANAVRELDARLAISRNRGQPGQIRIDSETFLLESGVVELRRCTAARRCFSDISQGAYALFLGGETGARATSPSRTAIKARVGERGEADLWGWITMPADLTSLGAGEINARLREVPFTKADNSGAPEVVIAISSDRLTLTSSALGSLGLRGDVLVERSRWLRDAQERVGLISLADPVPAAPVVYSPTLQNLSLDLDVATGSPFRADINIVSGLEAEADLHIGGTFADPEITGSVDVQRGQVNITLLQQPYEIVGGKISLASELRQSLIDLVAVGTEAVKVNGQLQYLTLALRGSLDQITFACSTAGSAGTKVASTRECFDFVLLDSGNADLSASDVRRAGVSNPLYGRPLALIGNATALKLNDVLTRETPRIEPLFPITTARVGQLGIEVDVATRPEWLRWDWGHLGFDYGYRRGYPGSLLRYSQAFTARLEILNHTAFEATFGARSYSNRVLILDPLRYRSYDLVQSWTVPSAR